MDDKSQTPASQQAQPETEPKPRTRNWGAQTIGALVGAFIGLVVAGIGNQLGWFEVNIARVALWGAVIGGLVGAVDALDTAGARLTHGTNRWLNIIVALLGMAVVFGAIFGLVYAISVLVQKLF